MKTLFTKALTLQFAGAFLVFTVIGTLTHELGHIAVAKSLGYNTTLHYSSMSWDGDWASANYNRHRLWVSLGGPVQTTLTGLIGLAILFFRRQKTKLNGLQRIDWLAVFLSLFWLREIFNLLISVSTGLLRGDDKYFGGDEARISRLLALPEGTFPIILGILGLAVALVVVFKVVPRSKRWPFITGGLLGGTVSYVIWMNLAGPVLLP